MSEKTPDNQEELLTTVTTESGEYDVYPSHVTVYSYKGEGSMLDNMFIRHPDAPYLMYHWRYDADTGEEVEGYEDMKARAIQLGATALLNLSKEEQAYESDRDVYIKQALSDLDDIYKKLGEGEST